MLNSTSSISQNSNVSTIYLNDNSKSSGNLPNSIVSKYDFLKLLTAQLKYQDPLSPVSNFDFISQAAQFNVLEQIIELNQKFETLTKLYDLTYTNSFLGKNIEWVDESGEIKKGLVEKLERREGLIWLKVEDNFVAPSWVISISKQDEEVISNEY